MNYLIQEMSLYLLAAFIVGVSYGWILRSFRAKQDQQQKQQQAQVAIQRLQAEQQQLQARLEQLQSVPVSGRAQDWQDDYPLEVITDIEPAIRDKLANQGIESTKTLWQSCQDDEAIYSLADKIAIEDFIIRRWVSIAVLMRVADIGFADAHLLERTEIYELADLAAQKPNRLVEKLAKNNQSPDSASTLPNAEKCASWIEHAQHLVQLEAS